MTDKEFEKVETERQEWILEGKWLMGKANEIGGEKKMNKNIKVRSWWNRQVRVKKKKKAWKNM